jgi:hypothetical protein
VVQVRVEQGPYTSSDSTTQTTAHRLALLTLLTSACLTLPVLLNKPLLGAGACRSIDAEEPPLAPGEKFGSVIVLGDRPGLGTEVSRDTVRTDLGRIEALVAGRRISRRS